MNLQYLTLPTRPQENDIQAFSPAQDLVTPCWERELLQFVLRHYIQPNTHFRCISIGEPKAEHYLTLSQIKQPESRLQFMPAYCIAENEWELFMGLHLDSEVVEAVNYEYRDQKKIRSFKHDYRQGLGLFKYEKPFDWYWIGLEATQNCSQQSMAKLLAEVLQHAHAGSVIGLDFAGKYHGTDTKGWEWEKVERLLEILPVNETANLQVKLLKKMDRSILVSQNQPIRNAIHDLLTPLVRTDLERLYLKAEHLLNPNAPVHVQAFLATLQNCWNALVHYTILCFAGEIKEPENFDDWESMPSPLKFSLKTMQRLLQDTEWIAYSDVRANILEPHLAYALRNLEYELQDGLGVGQYFTVLLQIHQEN